MPNYLKFRFDDHWQRIQMSADESKIQVKGNSLDFKYRPDVDGLRAVAVVLVMLFHAGLSFPGGYIGVDIFFVISGFLITGLILKEQQTGGFSLANFWVRRIKRILPAATVMVVCVLLFGYFFLLSPAFHDLGKSAISQQLMLSNFYFWKNSRYFAPAGDEMPLLHTWSLAVEEQFYIGYPILLMLLQRFHRNTLFTILLVVGLVSLAASQYGVLNHPTSTFYLLPTRAWELLMGGLIWWLPQSSKSRPGISATFSWISLGMLVAVSALYTSKTPFPGLAAFVPCLATAMLIYFNSGQLSLPAKILASKPFVFVGLMSYSLYLWHWPVLVFYRYWFGAPGLVQAILLLSLSSVIALVSYLFIETPLRKFKLPDYAYYAGALSTICLLVLAAMMIDRNSGFPGKFPEAELIITESPFEKYTTAAQVKQGELPTIGTSNSDAPRVLCWGDSHLSVLLPELDECFQRNHIQGVVATRGATPPLLNIKHSAIVPWINNERKLWKSAVIDYIKKNEVTDVLLAARWSWYIHGDLNGDEVVVISTDDPTCCTAESPEETLERSLIHTIAVLRDAGARVWIMRQVPLQTHDPNRTIVLAEVFNMGESKGTSKVWNIARHEKANQIIDKLQSADFHALDPDPFCFDKHGNSRIFDGSRSLYWDDDHLSAYGSKVLLNELFEDFSRRLNAMASEPE